MAEALGVIPLGDDVENVRAFTGRGDVALASLLEELSLFLAGFVVNDGLEQHAVGADTDMVFTADLYRVLHVSDQIRPCGFAGGNEEGHPIDTDDSSLVGTCLQFRVPLIAWIVVQRATSGVADGWRSSSGGERF